MANEEIPFDAWDLLSPQLTEKRRCRMLSTIAKRTKHIRLVVQDVHQPHNVSACIRSAEGFGIQKIEVVNLKTKFDTSTVARGVDSWVDIQKHASVESCIEKLHQEGFIVAAAFPHGKAVSLEDLPVDKPIALVFGNEHEGLLDSWRTLSDIQFTIPMSGIVESLNISVSAAVSMYTTSQRAQKAVPQETYFFSADEQKNILNRWICGQITSWKGQLKILRGR